MYTAPSFLQMVDKLSKFWSGHGCAIVNSYDIEMGAATFHPHTILSVIEDKPTSIAFLQSCRRPQDGRAGSSGNRLYKHNQFQVIMMPPPSNIQEMVINSLYECGINPNTQNIDFVENNWNSPSLGASGRGYEVQVNGSELLQFTYFQQIAGCELGIIPVELAYGVERICKIVQNKDHFYDMNWNEQVTYGDINARLENDSSKGIYNTAHLWTLFDAYEKLVEEFAEQDHLIPGYEMFLKMSHIFNLIENSGHLSINERVALMDKVRNAANLSLQRFIKNKPQPSTISFRVPDYVTDHSEIQHHELFIEIMSEKLPLQANLRTIFTNSILQEFGKYSNLRNVKFTVHTSCQRLVLVAPSFPNAILEEKARIKGPKADVPTEVVEKFLQKHGKNHEDLEIEEIKGEKFYYIKEKIIALHVKALLPEMVHNIIKNMRCPEYMRWTEGIEWMRPIRRIVTMYNEQYIVGDLQWIKTSVSSLYELNDPEEFIYSNSNAYFQLLSERGVFLPESDRRAFVDAQIKLILEKNNLMLDDQSKSTISHILASSESPIIHLAEYEYESFDLPQKIRELVMIHHQNFVPLFGPDGSASNKFLTHSNKKLNDGGEELKKDCAQAISLRFQEAERFWKRDISLSYEEHVEMLKKSAMYEGLGSLHHQTVRLGFVVEKFFADVPHLATAARFVNIDLSMDSVFEIPEMHGIASANYAMLLGHEPSVGRIIIDSTFPKNDEPLPQNLTEAGGILGFCTRLDMLIGLIGKGRLSRGSSDPFGLRRCAYGLVRLRYTLRDLPDIRDMIKHLIDLYREQGVDLAHDCEEIAFEFIKKRAETFIMQISPKFGAAFCPRDSITWDEDTKLKSFMDNEQTHSDYLRFYKRLKGICRSGVFAYETPLLIPESRELHELFAKTLSPEYPHLYTLLEKANDLVDKVHINSLKPEVADNLLGLLGAIKNIVDEYCDVDMIQI